MNVCSQLRQVLRGSATGASSDVTLAAPGTTPPAAGFARFTRELPERPEGEEGLASARLCRRLGDDGLAEIERSVEADPNGAAHLQIATSEVVRRHVLLSFAIWLGLPGVAEATGLGAVQPPEDVHAMARGPLAAAGGLYEADMMVDALARAGVHPAEGARWLDFGCSSGRVVRVLAAAYPEIGWSGCDPNERAIAWATGNLPGIDFFVGPQRPPLPFEDGALDLVYAISIWSHFASQTGLLWLAEMRRAIRPGGHLVITTHGLTSLARDARLQLRSPAQLEEIADALYRQGWWYAPEFGDSGDWGVVDPDWGTAVLAPEWLLAQLCPGWRVVEFAPGRNQENQDLWVLQRP